MYLERLSVFDYTNNEYYVPNGKFNTRSATDSIALPNCTMYCFLRMQEASEQKERQNKWIRANGGFGNAKTWYDTTTLPKGSEIKDGAIAVFDGTYGHVAFVERKIDDTHAFLTESNYNDNKNLRNWYFFNKRPSVELVVGKSTIKGVGKLLGFIYLPIVDKRVDQDDSKHQVKVIDTMVNVRISPNGGIFSKGLYCPMGYYDVLETFNDGTYKWFKLDNDMWIREGDWTKENIPSIDEDEELKKEIANLKTKLDKIKEIINE